MKLKEEHLIDGKYSFKDLVDLKQLKVLFENFSKATGFTTGLVSYPDQTLLIATGWRDICTKFHRSAPSSAVHCKASNLELTKQLQKKESMNLCHCASGLVDGATPIIISGIHIANLFTGQILFKKPDIDFFRKQAEKYKYEIEPYIKALKKVPVVNEKAFKKALKFLSGMAVMLAEQGYTNLQNNIISQEANEKKEQLHITLHSIGEAVISTNNQGKIVLMNPTAEKLTGWQSPEAIGKSLSKIFKTAKPITKKNNKPHKHKQSTKFKTTTILTSQSGEKYQIENTTTPIHNKKGNSSGMVMVFRNTTEEQKTKKAIKESEIKYRTLFESANDSIQLLEGDLFIECNSTAVTMYGCKNKAEMIGKSPSDFSPEFQPDGSNSKEKADYYIAAAKNKKPQQFYWKHIKKDGTPIDVEVSLNRLTIGKKTYIQAIGRDITKRQQIQAALLNSEARFSQILENSPSIIYIKDKEGRYIVANKQFRKLFNNSKRTIINKTDYQLFSKKVADQFRNNDSIVIETGKPLTVDEHTIINQQQRSYISVKFPLRDSQNKIIGSAGVSIDITERERIKEELQKSEERLRLLTNHLPSVMLYQVIAELKGTRKFTYISDNIFAINGIRKEDALKDATSLYKLIPTEQLPELIRKEKIALKKRTIFTHEVQFRHQTTDRLRWYQLISTPHKLPNGDTVWEGAQIDITKLKNIEEQLKENEKKFRQFYESSLDGYVRTDMQGRVLEFNQAYKKMLGYKNDKDLERLSYKKFTPKKWHTFEKKIITQQVMARGYSDLYEKEYIKQDGTTIPIELRVYLFKDNANKPTGMWAFVSEITERKKNSEQLKQLRNFLSNIINSMPSALIAVDTNGKISQWNKTAESRTGVPEKKAIGMVISDILKEIQPKEITQSITSQKPIRFEKLRHISNNNTHYEELTIYPLTANGAKGAVIRIDDITDRVRMEEMMVQNEKMLSVGGLAAGMAHEINNPLAGIIQTASVLMNRLKEKGNIPANRKAAEETGTTIDVIYNYMEKRGIIKMLDAIKKSGERVASIVRNMLSFARKSEVTLTSHNISFLLDKSLELAKADYDLKKHYDFRQITIKKEYQEKIPILKCEASKIQQVLLNIFRNGAQAMHTAKTIKPTFTIRAYFKKAQNMIYIEIEDNGPGMQENVRKRIFEPFYTTKPVGQGTGLGLSVSYFIITENHNGELTVESQPGKGTKFTIKLPLEYKDKMNTKGAKK